MMCSQCQVMTFPVLKHENCVIQSALGYTESVGGKSGKHAFSAPPTHARGYDDNLRHKSAINERMQFVLSLNVSRDGWLMSRELGVTFFALNIYSFFSYSQPVLRNKKILE